MITQEKWNYLKSEIRELRDAKGKCNQKETCQFILNLMAVIEEDEDRKFYYDYSEDWG